MNAHAPNSNQPVLAIGAMLCAVFAAVAIGSLPTRTAGDGTVAAAWLQDIETGADHVDPAELTRELLAARGDLLLVDVRPAAEYAAFHLPSAVNLTVPDLLGEPGAALLAKAPRRVVLYSNGPAHPGQAWVELRRRGLANVHVLDGGLEQFTTSVLLPPSLRPGADEASAKAALASWSTVRAFVLGAKASAHATWATDPAALSQPTMVSPGWLHDRLGKVAIVDVRSEREFLAWHVPGAVRLDLAKIRTRTGDRDHLFVADDKLAAWFGNLGIAVDTPLVLVADDKPQDATMAAMAFLRLGHRALAILVGGLLRWATERRPLTPELTMPNAVAYTPRPGGDDFTITADELAKGIAGGGTKVLDVRPADFFRGDKSTEARPGHIPGAVNRLYTKDLERTADGQWLRPRADLAKDYAALGLQTDDPVAVSCRTGHTASHSFFVMRYLLGYRNARWYAGSWTDWAARTDLPAATGDK